VYIPYRHLDYQSTHFRPNEVQKNIFQVHLKLRRYFSYLCDFTIDWRTRFLVRIQPPFFHLFQIRNLQDELNQVRREDDGRITDLESVLRYVIRTVSFLPTLEKNSEIHSTFSEFSRHREKNAELEKTLATQREKEDEAEKTLAEFKTKMEETSKRMFDDAKIQVLKFFVWNYISYLQLNRVECLLGASPGPVDPGRFF
jgi:uncharacterized protein (UPF0305 family)